ncbi:hypothetical protein [Phenylobacterium sp.]|uniref:hypothetical protein n=1 Tax=Phenylobacterium sp. TaxID=1871053 RepID=UPI00198FD07B|nr:hypothetical protein [Phenylobacterium sp.]MBC7169062.1 hypothetical protein [Phenylobacterium sp.]
MIAANSMDAAPRDGRLLRLLVDYSPEANAAEIEQMSAAGYLWPHTPFEDTCETAWTVGFNSLENTGEDKWQFVGWHWSQDCFTEGYGVVVGWLPFHDPSPSEAQAQIGVLEARLAELNSLLNAPELRDFAYGAVLEAAHQRERFSVDHDAGKGPEDWFWLVGYLAGKALRSAIAGDLDKALHHCISTAAVLANWHAALLGADNRMRPGIAPPDGEGRP